MRRLILALVVVAGPLVAGCRYHHHGHVGGPVVIVGHIHGAGCGHVYSGGYWYEPAPVVVVRPPAPRPFHHGPRIPFPGRHWR
ncbi:MAG: hypothetical protein HYY18_22760 [Planctomycetes bacterium]|nr:hypothetical protein [Planctomycetota bacterium]